MATINQPTRRNSPIAVRDDFSEGLAAFMPASEFDPTIAI
jgi:hypothetical protein